MNDVPTWDEMYNYLIQQKNCVITDNEFTVLDMHYTLKELNDSINLYTPESRAKSRNCKSLKSILQRMYESHKQNKFKLIKT